MEIKAERELASSLFNSCWRLIEKSDRTPEEDAEMLHLAHASRWHWGNVGGVKEWSIGEWQCSKVYSFLGNGKAALLHAQLSVQLSKELEPSDFMRASALEALALAHFISGEIDLALKYKEEAIANLVGVDEVDAHHILEQIQELPF